MAVQDTRTFGQAPKLDRYGDVSLLVFYGAREDGRLVENHLYVAAGWLMTVRRSPCIALEQLEGERAGHPDAWIVYGVMDALTDTFLPGTRELDEQVDALEDRVLDGDSATARREVVDLRRRLLALRRVLASQRDVLDRSLSDLPGLPGFGAIDLAYFRDVLDSLRRLTASAEATRDRLVGVLDMADNALATRLNASAERLTVLATLLVPLTVLTGFFGMNFGWLVDRIHSLGAFLGLGIGLPIAIVAGLLALLRRRGYLD
jgi:magnesium transporter